MADGGLSLENLDLSRVRRPFPGAPRWEVTPENAQQWQRDGFLTALLWDLVDHPAIDLTCDEGAILRQDILVWRKWDAAWGRGERQRPPTLAEYLQPGREEWGWLARVIRAVQAQRQVEEQRQAALREKRLEAHRQRQARKAAPR